MSIENTSSYISSNASGASASGSTSVDTASLESLKTAFVQAMRVSLGGTSDRSSDSTLLEATDTAAQRRRELNQDRNVGDRTQDFLDRSRTERRELDRSEIRHEQLDGEYDHGLDRRNDTKNDFVRKADRAESLAATDAVRDVIPISEGRVDASLPVSAISTTSSNPFSLAPAPSTPNADLPSVGTLPASFLVAGASSLFAGPVTEAGAMPNISMPVTPTPMLPNNIGNISTSLQATASVLTIFSVSGRIGDKDDKDEAKDSEKKKEKKERSVSLFGTTVFNAFLETDRKDATVETAGKREQEIVTVREWNGERSQTEETKDIPAKEDREEHFSDSPLKSKPSENVVAPSPETSSPEALHASPSAPSPESSAEEQLDRVRFIQRVAAACQSAAQQHGNLRIKLNLDRLGSLTIRASSRASSQGRRLDVRLEASTEAAARLLRDNLDELKNVLAEQNVVLDQIDVVLLPSERET